jgi:hypothetical protein
MLRSLNYRARPLSCRLYLSNPWRLLAMYVSTVRHSILEFPPAPRLSLPKPDHLIGTPPACAHALRRGKPIVRQFE